VLAAQVSNCWMPSPPLFPASHVHRVRPPRGQQVTVGHLGARCVVSSGVGGRTKMSETGTALSCGCGDPDTDYRTS
jgi:hypothetical protein